MLVLNRIWAMPSADTFDIPPIGDFVKRYLSGVSVDPFARNKRWATHTNDLNPETEAECHMEAREFLQQLAGKGVKADVVIFDPPYSAQQIKEMYKGFGKTHWSFHEHEDLGRWREEKRIACELLKTGGIFLHFGWHTNGAGRERGFDILEILMVAHGGVRHDTLCMAEQKRQGTLF